MVYGSKEKEDRRCVSSCLKPLKHPPYDLLSYWLASYDEQPLKKKKGHQEQECDHLPSSNTSTE